MPCLHLTSVDFLDISLEYRWGMWWTTVSPKLSNAAMCLVIILVARIVNSQRRKPWVLCCGSDDLSLYCWMSVVGLMLEMWSVGMRSWTAIWWIQWMLLLLLLMDWLYVWTKKSRLSMIMEYDCGHATRWSSGLGAGVSFSSVEMHNLYKWTFDQHINLSKQYTNYKLVITQSITVTV